MAKGRAFFLQFFCLCGRKDREREREKKRKKGTKEEERERLERLIEAH